MLGPAITAACLAGAGAAHACPSSYGASKRQADDQAQAERAVALESHECAYAKRGGARSAPAKVALAAVPAGVAAFVLGWRSAGRRRRGFRRDDEVSK